MIPENRVLEHARAAGDVDALCEALDDVQRARVAEIVGSAVGGRVVVMMSMVPVSTSTEEPRSLVTAV